MKSSEGLPGAQRTPWRNHQGNEERGRRAIVKEDEPHISTLSEVIIASVEWSGSR